MICIRCGYQDHRPAKYCPQCRLILENDGSLVPGTRQADAVIRQYPRAFRSLAGVPSLLAARSTPTKPDRDIVAMGMSIFAGTVAASAFGWIAMTEMVALVVFLGIPLLMVVGVCCYFARGAWLGRWPFG